MIEAELEKTISPCNAHALTGLGKDRHIEAPQVEHSASKEVVRFPLFNPAGQGIVAIKQQGKRDPLRMSKNESCTQSDRFLDALK